MAERNFAEFARRLQMAAKNKGFRGAADIAAAANMNRITIGAYLRGERAASLEACVTLSKALDCSPSWLHSGKAGGEIDQVFRGARREEINRNLPKITRMPTTVDLPNASDAHNVHAFASRQIPLYSSALAGPDGAVTIGVDNMEQTESPTTLVSVPNAYAVRVSGESMEPRYFTGEIVYVHPTTPVKRGDFVVAQISENGHEGAIQGYVKRFVSIDDKQLVLEQLNPRKEMKFARNRVQSVHKIILGG